LQIGGFLGGVAEKEKSLERDAGIFDFLGDAGIFVFFFEFLRNFKNSGAHRSLA
jgi:hypothetical protein